MSSKKRSAHEAGLVETTSPKPLTKREDETNEDFLTRALEAEETVFIDTNGVVTVITLKDPEPVATIHVTTTGCCALDSPLENNEERCLKPIDFSEKPIYHLSFVVRVPVSQISSEKGRKFLWKDEVEKYVQDNCSSIWESVWDNGNMENKYKCQFFSNGSILVASNHTIQENVTQEIIPDNSARILSFWLKN